MRQSRRTRIFRKGAPVQLRARRGKSEARESDLYQSALGMIPQAVIAVMSGGHSAAAQGGSTLAGARTTLFPTSRGSLRRTRIHEQLLRPRWGRTTAKAAGASDAEAAFSAILFAATAGIETMGGIDARQGQRVQIAECAEYSA